MTTGYHPDKLDKLPRWAQDHIAVLTRTLAETEAVLKVKNHEGVKDRDGIGVTLTYWNGNERVDVETDYQSVTYRNIRVIADRRGMRIHAAHGEIRVIPQAANALLIESERDS